MTTKLGGSSSRPTAAESGSGDRWLAWRPPPLAILDVRTRRSTRRAPPRLLRRFRRRPGRTILALLVAHRLSRASSPPRIPARPPPSAPSRGCACVPTCSAWPNRAPRRGRPARPRHRAPRAHHDAPCSRSARSCARTTRFALVRLRVSSSASPTSDHEDAVRAERASPLAVPTADTPSWRIGAP